MQASLGIFAGTALPLVPAYMAAYRRCRPGLRQDKIRQVAVIWVHSALCRKTDLGYTEAKDLGDCYHKRGND